MKTKITITVTIPASEPQTTTKEIQVPSFWKFEPKHKVSVDYILVLKSTTIKVVKYFNGGYMGFDTQATALPNWQDYKEIPKDEAIQVFSEMQEAHRKSVFGDTTQKEIQNISIVDAYVENKPVIQLEIERKHTDF